MFTRAPRVETYARPQPSSAADRNLCPAGGVPNWNTWTRRAGRMAKVLVVEDNPDVLSVGAQALEEQGHTPHRARTYAETIRTVLANAFDVIVADVQLPDGKAYD